MKKKVCLIIMSLLALSAAALFYFRILYYTKDAQRASDLARINEEKPEGIMLSMMPTESYNAEDMGHFLGITAIKAEHRVENLYDIRDFLNALEESPDVVYLALDPVFIASRYGYHASFYERAYADTLLSAVRENADTSYRILLSYYSLAYWKTLSDKEREDAISAYRDFVNIFQAEPNVAVHFMGAEEWLIANPDNYETKNSCNEPVTRYLIAITIASNNYKLNPENMEEKFSMIRTMAEGKSTDPLLAYCEPSAYPDLSDTDIVFFGDSVIGNFRGSSSIPGVVAGLSGAKTYNLGIGGTTATYRGGAGDVSLLGVVEAFLNQNSSLFQGDYEQGAQDMKAFYDSRAGEGKSRDTYFIISFGLNDYFNGLPVDVPASDDERFCYAGALRAAVVRLREGYPESRIILMTPNYSAEFHGGMDINAPGGGQLSEYADAVFRVAAEMDAEVIDNFGGVGINADNMGAYITDGTHPNERGRYVIGRYIVGSLTNAPRAGQQ